METMTSSPQTLDAASLSSFSADVFLDLNSSREALSSWNGFIAGSVAGNSNFEVLFVAALGPSQRDILNA